jgi:hypothetical protein
MFYPGEKNAECAQKSHGHDKGLDDDILLHFLHPCLKTAASRLSAAGHTSLNGFPPCKMETG